MEYTEIVVRFGVNTNIDPAKLAASVRDDIQGCLDRRQLPAMSGKETVVLTWSVHRI